MKLDAFFRPISVAIIGASATPNKVGHILVNNMLKSGFSGKIYPINPSGEQILGLKCYTSVKVVPYSIDLAVIAIPAKLIPPIIEECGEKSIKAIIIISAGFKEIGHEGAELENQIISIAQKYNMRIQGPNCLGILNTHTPIDLSFAAALPKKGNIGFISQSGALGTAVLDWIIKEEIGFHSFISLGNKADLDEVDFIEAMAEDPAVKVILVYVESIENGHRFLKISSQAVKKKPIVILKGGISSAGAKAAGSHTGALVGSFLAYQTAFKKAGVILAQNVEELFNYGIAFSNQPLPYDEGIAIITNAGGPGILATDLCEKLGVRLSSLNSELQNRLRQNLPFAASTGNPVDVLGDAKADRYQYVLQQLLNDIQVNAIVLILTPQAMTESLETAKSLVTIREKYSEKLVLSVFMGGKLIEEASIYLRNNGTPCFNFPEKAIQTLSGMYEYTRYLKRPESIVSIFKEVNKEKVKKIIREVRNDGRVVLLSTEAADVAEAYGIIVPRNKLAKTSDEAVKFAEDLGYPVVLRIVSPDIIHKTDVGGVALNLKTSSEVRYAFDNIMMNVGQLMPRARQYGVMIYSMVPKGQEMIIGMSQDIQFGPLIMVGLGGIYVNFLKDVSFRLSPVSQNDASEMVEETKAYTLLKGIRGEAPSDIDSLKETIQRVSQLVEDFPEILEMDINPIMIYKEGEGYSAIDVKITLSKEE